MEDWLAGQKGTGPDLGKKWWICDSFMKENVSFLKAWLAGSLAGWLTGLLWPAGRWPAGCLWPAGWSAGKPELIFVTGPC